MCGVNLTSFGCEEKILSKEHIVQWAGVQNPYIKNPLIIFPAKSLIGI